MVSEELAKLRGKVGDIRIMEVERGAIKRYADAVGDHNPLYWDVEYARGSRYGSTVAPPGFFGWPTSWTRSLPNRPALDFEVAAILEQAGYPVSLDAEVKYEFFCPLRAGDTLTALARVIDIHEREGRNGKLIFFTTEEKYTNQNGDLVAKVRHTYIHR